MTHWLKVSGIIYSVLSVLLLPFLLFLQMMSVFLFDDPARNVLPYFLALGILLIPIVLVIANVLMWLSISKSEKKMAVVYMLIPVMYTILFFLLWSLIDLIF